MVETIVPNAATDIIEATASHLAWGAQSEAIEESQKSVSWQLKGIVKVGVDLLALVVVENKLTRVKLGDNVLNSKIDAIQDGGVTVSEVDDQGVAQTRFVKISR